MVRAVFRPVESSRDEPIRHIDPAVSKPVRTTVPWFRPVCGLLERLQFTQGRDCCWADLVAVVRPSGCEAQTRSAFGDTDRQRSGPDYRKGFDRHYLSFEAAERGPPGVSPPVFRDVGGMETAKFVSQRPCRVFFSMAAGIFIASRRAGWFALFYVSAFICLPRMYLGEHYATDILAGAVIGIVPVCVANLPWIRQPLTNWGMKLLDANPPFFYFMASLVLYLVVELFEPLIKVGKLMYHLA